MTETIHQMQKSLLNINPEEELLQEIKDILDELFMMHQIKIQQFNAIRALVKNIKPMVLTSSNTSGHSLVHNHSKSTSSCLSETTVANATTLNRAQTNSTSYLADEQPDLDEQQNWTLRLAHDLLESIQDQKIELKNLQDAANKTHSDLKGLLALKQQQAGVVEARESVKLGEETLKQGRSIMLFTIVTIIFVSKPSPSCILLGSNNTT